MAICDVCLMVHSICPTCSLPIVYAPEIHGDGYCDAGEHEGSA